MLQQISKTLLNTAKRLVVVPSKSFHLLSKTPLNAALNAQKSQFLRPAETALVPSCGFKVVGKVERRCKDCFIVIKRGRFFNYCKKHGRHKQMSMVKDEKNTWILTHATQGKIRPW